MGGIAHVVVAEIAGVEVMAAIVARQHARRMLRVAQGPVEVDHCIESPAFADPLVDRLARLLAYRRPCPGQEGFILERRQGGAEDLDTGSPSTHPTLF